MPEKQGAGMSFWFHGWIHPKSALSPSKFPLNRWTGLLLNLWTPRLPRAAWVIPLLIPDTRSWLRYGVGATRLNNLEVASGIVPSETSAVPNRSRSTTSVSARHRTGRRLSGAGVLNAEISEKQARSIKYQMTIARLPLAKEVDEFSSKTRL